MSREISVLIAPDKFKGSATARTVAEALTHGIRCSAPRATVDTRPIADGGDGTVAVLLSSGHQALTVPSADALGKPTTAIVATSGHTAVIEMASACGLTVASLADPLQASSLGLGVALRHVIDLGFQDIIIGLGGSASTDGGLGLIMALGAKGFAADGLHVTPDAHGLLALHSLDTTDLSVSADLCLRVACDVSSPLHGPRGAAMQFGPQKGASNVEVLELDAALVRLGTVLKDTFGTDPSGVPGAGAAGGTAAMAVAALGGVIVDGADFVLDVLHMNHALGECDIVITGEGSWDSQSAMGKGPGRLAELAHAAGIPVIVVAGQVASNARDSQGVVEYWSLADHARSTAVAQRDVEPLLIAAGEDIGLRLSSLAERRPK